MSNPPLIERTQHGGLAVLALQSGPRNVLTPTLLTLLIKELGQARDAGARAILLRSNLPDFADGNQDEQFKKLLAGQATGAEEMLELLRQFDSFSLPIVAAVRGRCVGAGCELALACDFVVASASAHIRFVEVDTSLHPAAADLHDVAQSVEGLRARTPVELEKAGLLTLVVSSEQVEKTALMIAQQLAVGPTLAHIATKKLSNIALHEGLPAADAAMSELQKPLWASEDIRTGLAALKATGLPGTAIYQGR